MDDIGLILQALDFAAERHKDQLRKGINKRPYINHPIQVATILANEAGETDPVLISAAILHDVIEDTVDSQEEKQELIKGMTEVFGKKILSLVLEVTDDKTLEKQERKRLQIEMAPLLSDNAKKLKIADKTANVHDIISDPPAGWSAQRLNEYLDWTERVVKGLRGGNKVLENVFDKNLKKARKSLQ